MVLIDMEMPNKKSGAVLIIYPDGKCAFEDGKTYQAIPAADVMEVVRCQDCSVGMCYSDGSVQCEWSNGFYADDYCPRGKRKGGDK